MGKTPVPPVPSEDLPSRTADDENLLKACKESWDFWDR